MPRDRRGFHLKGTLTIQTLADVLSQTLRKPVANETGLDGRFMLSLDFAPDSLEASDSGDELAPPLSEALRNQLGIKLEPQKVNFRILVIDHIERNPTEN